MVLDPQTLREKLDESEARYVELAELRIDERLRDHWEPGQSLDVELSAEIIGDHRGNRPVPARVRDRIKEIYERAGWLVTSRVTHGDQREGSSLVFTFNERH